MKFLPYEHLKISTALSREVVLKELDSVVEPKRYFRLFGSGSKPYQGSIKGSHFEISRIIGYGNSFLLMIKGDVESELSGCSIHITMRPRIFATAFMMFWLGGVGLFFLVFLIAMISGATNSSALSVPATMCVLGYAMFLGGFKFESSKSKKFFQELFEARDVEEFGIANPFEKAG